MPSRSRTGEEPAARAREQPTARAREEPTARPRVAEVDVLRGFALFGVMIVNTVGITGMPTPAPDQDPGPVHWAYEVLLHQRFFPIFSLLFGVSFGLFLDSARPRTPYPRLLMLARLGFLIPIGALHRLLQPGEVLLTYAVVGIVVLLPASFVPGRRLLLALGLAATAAAVPVGGSALVPGLFLVGHALQRYGPANILDAPKVRLWAALLGSLALAVVLNAWQVVASAATTSTLATSASLATAACYTAAVAAAVRSRAGRPLRGLAPLGRTALTAYVGATFAIIAADRFVRLAASPDHLVAVAVGTGVFALALAFAHLWLRHARYGPLEWVWRCLTWWTPSPPGPGRA
ncbi:DUF418 domain-containing protein [Actinomadura algeriensis]|uniref:Membrane protein YeiB n=1 Tax=Actinomadura algeriensis TaxID=1679523 RepID=A0ABR9JNG4_9ACTN|nr:DUF418 domain-containing protein [Actinomadura algeriensis]MBE1531974.1 putative membrane protein YeiB [Actinomadura algeriensis]